MTPRPSHTRYRLLRIIFRIARYSPVSGVSLDWLTVTEKKSSGDEADAESAS